MKTVTVLKKLINKKIKTSYVVIIINGILSVMIINDGFAQTNAQKLQIQAATNLAALNQMAVTSKNIATQEKQLAEQWAIANGYPVKGVTDGVFFEIQKLDAVSGMPQYYITNNLNSAKTISTNKVWSGGGANLNLSGFGYTIGEWDLL